MKIRWNRNSLRLRITPTELATLESGKTVVEELQVPGFAASSWRVAVTVLNDGKTGLQQTSGDRLLIHLSADDFRRLGEPEREGVYFTCDHGTQRFAYYIEKDYPCAHPRASEVQALLNTHDLVNEETFTKPVGLATAL